MKDLKVGDKLHEGELITQGYLDMLKEQDERFKELITAYSNYCASCNRNLDILVINKFISYKARRSDRIK